MDDNQDEQDAWDAYSLTGLFRVKPLGDGYIHSKHKYLGKMHAKLHLYDEGNVVIVGRGGQYILRDSEDVWHVLLVADLKHRIRFLMDYYYLNQSEAEKAIHRADNIRSRFLSLFEDELSQDDPLSYHLTLNMGRLSMDHAERLVADLIDERQSSEV